MKDFQKFIDELKAEKAKASATALKCWYANDDHGYTYNEAKAEALAFTIEKAELLMLAQPVIAH